MRQVCPTDNGALSKLPPELRRRNFADERRLSMPKSAPKREKKRNTYATRTHSDWASTFAYHRCWLGSNLESEGFFFLLEILLKFVSQLNGTWRRRRRRKRAKIFTSFPPPGKYLRFQSMIRMNFYFYLIPGEEFFHSLVSLLTSGVQKKNPACCLRLISLSPALSLSLSEKRFFFQSFSRSFFSSSPHLLSLSELPTGMCFKAKKNPCNSSIFLHLIWFGHNRQSCFIAWKFGKWLPRQVGSSAFFYDEWIMGGEEEKSQDPPLPPPPPLP